MTGIQSSQVYIGTIYLKGQEKSWSLDLGMYISKFKVCHLLNI